MKTLIDFLPVIAFFVAYFVPGPADIYRATVVLMIAMALQVSTLWLMDRVRKARASDAVPLLNRMHLVSAGLVLVLGTATIVLHNDLFIKWKPTVVDWLFAAVFLGSQLFTGKSLIERAAGDNLTLPAPVWRSLNLAWVIFFFVLGVLNLVVVYNFSEAIWVNFKLFGSLALTFLFVLAQGLWIQRHLPGETQTEVSEGES
jgi:intracellular septation protein